MQDSEYLGPLADYRFRQEMDKPSTLDDVFGSLSPEYNQHFWQPHQYQRPDSGIAFPPQHGGMVQGDFSLDDYTMGQQGDGFDMAPTGNTMFGSAPGEFGSGSRGHSAATSRVATPGPGADQNSSTGSVWQPSSESDGQPDSSSTLGGDY